MLRFANSSLLHLLWLVPLLVVFYVYVFKAKTRAMKRFGNLELLKRLSQNTSRTRQIAKVVMIIVAVVFMIYSAARPQIGTKLEEVKREGVDIIVAMDVSASMLAKDIPPSRLSKAKHEVENFIDLLKGDRIGLIAFSGVAFVQCPLTLDYGAAKMFLNIMSPDLIPTPGTAIGRAIELAIKAFEQKERKYKVLILITDGEDHQGNALKFAEEADRQGIVIYCVGIGSPKGEPIPLSKEGRKNVGFKKDRQGNVVITKLDEVMLEKIALQTGGKYYRATSGEDELHKIYDEISKMEKKELGSMQFSQFEDRFQYIIIFAIILLVIEMVVPERRKVQQEWRGRFM